MMAFFAPRAHSTPIVDQDESSRLTMSGTSSHSGTYDSEPDIFAPLPSPSNAKSFRAPTTMPARSDRMEKEKKLSKIANTPMFGELQDMLKEACARETVPQTLLEASLPETYQSNVPLSLAISQLQMKFMMLEPETTYKKDTEKLHCLYRINSAKLESDRFDALQKASPSAHTWINQGFDSQHHQIIQKVTKGLESIVSSIHRAKDTANKMRKRDYLCPVAIHIMNSWYRRHWENPYPCAETCELMAKAGNVTVEQVEMWFQSKRTQEYDCTAKDEISRIKKRLRDESHPLRANKRAKHSAM